MGQVLHPLCGLCYSIIANPPLPPHSSRSLPSRRPFNEVPRIECAASVAVTLDLEPTGGLAAPREGKVTFTVYAFPLGGVGLRSLFQSWDEWGATFIRFTEGFPLKKTMTMLMKVCVGGQWRVCMCERWWKVG